MWIKDNIPKYFCNYERGYLLESGSFVSKTNSYTLLYYNYCNMAVLHTIHEVRKEHSDKTS